MFAAIAQALVYQGFCDYENGILKENCHIEFLAENIWKASRFGFDAKIIDPISLKILSIEDKIEEMLDYIAPALIFFSNEEVIKDVQNILLNGTEGDSQISIYQQYGMDTLKASLLDNVDYNYEF